MEIWHDVESLDLDSTQYLRDLSLIQQHEGVKEDKASFPFRFI